MVKGNRFFEQFDYHELLGILENHGILSFYHQRASELQVSLFVDPYGIHGINHARRVLMLALILSFLNGLGQKDKDILVLAALYHDIGRTHNGRCTVHGEHSYKKMVKLNLVPAMEPHELILLKYIIENHCIEDDRAFKNAEQFHTDRHRAIELLKLLKDADNLDRVRLGDLDVRYLRTPYARQLVTVAEMLFQEISQVEEDTCNKVLEFSGDRFCSRCGGIHIRNAQEAMQVAEAFGIGLVLDTCYCEECGCARVGDAIKILYQKIMETPDNPLGARARAIDEIRLRRAKYYN